MGQLSIRVNLTVLKQFDIELFEKVPDCGEFFRIVGWVQLKKSNGWIEPSQTLVPERSLKKIGEILLAKFSSSIQDK